MVGTNTVTISNDGSKGYYLVQFQNPILPDWKVQIEKISEISGYVPENTYILHLNGSQINRIKSLPYFKWMGEYKPEYKVDPDLYGLDGETIIVISTFKSNSAELKNSLLEMDASLVAENGNQIRVKINGSVIPLIAQCANVVWIEPYNPPVILNDKAGEIIGVDRVASPHNLTGANQTIAIADTGLDTGNLSTLHPDIGGRVDALYDWSDGNPADNNGHGTHVAGSALGNGYLSAGQYKGMAPEAHLFFQACGDGSKTLNIPPLNQLFIEAYNNGSRIHSNSWGSSSSYATDAKALDNFTWHHPDMLILFAAGNDGPSTGTINSPGIAKNALTVGASENYRPERGGDSDNPSDIADFSSRGPTFDGRIKPDIVTPGTSIYSTASSLVYPEDYVYMSGTSMATPVTAGSAALIRQYFMNNIPIHPSAALLKATLINGAVDLNHSYYSQGWGRLDLTKSIDPVFPAHIRLHDNINLSTNTSWTAKYYVDNTQTPLKATLVWTDYPATASASKALVNNLDLVITSPNYSKYYGNGAPDNVNNVEQIQIDSPEAGWYSFSVNGTKVPQGSEQPFAFVISGGSLNNETVVKKATVEPESIGASGPENAILKVELNEHLVNSAVYADLSQLGLPSQQNLTNNSGIWEYELNSKSEGTYYFGINVTYNESSYDNSTFVKLNIIDNIPPANVTDLYPVNTGYSWINWSWTNPNDSDFSNSLVYIDGIQEATLNRTHYNATGLFPNTSHTISIRTVDNNGNINQNWTNNTSGTQTDVIYPQIHDIMVNNSENLTAGELLEITVNSTDDYMLSEVLANGKQLSNLEGTLWRGNLVILPGMQYINISAMDTSGNKVWNNSTCYSGLIMPQAHFTSNVTSGKVPLSVQFNDTSHNATEWNWDIDGDSSIDYAIQNPSHVYNKTGAYSVTLTVNNTNGTDTYSFENYIEVEPRNPATNGGGSGGGGGSTTAEDYSNIIFKDFSIRSITVDEPVTYEFKEPKNPVRQIDLISARNAGQVKFTVELLKNTSSLVNKPSAGLVYHNLNIWAENSAFSENIQNSSVIFRIDQDWFDQENVDVKDIVLEVFENGTWIALPTEYINKSTNYLYFKADTDRYLNAPFVIMGTEYIKEIEEPIAEKPELEPQSEKESQSENQDAQTPGFTGMFVVALIAGAALVMRKRI
ncbi:S8 family serine peptidase [Methanohalophilus mahii]|uniref:S8 family serine peptidase n=1 Tax=Methanohalophilus mahii TaxID=2176 RepID=UPI00155B38FD|nr:S8 family serine peptidase [Methanohalophilus mahii]